MPNFVTAALLFYFSFSCFAQVVPKNNQLQMKWNQSTKEKDEKNEKDFEKKLEIAIQNTKKYNSFSTDFKQEFYSVLRDRVILSSGKLTVQAPNSFRFETNSPRNELYISDGVDFWKYTPAFKHVQHLKANTSAPDFIRLLTNLSELKKMYRVSQWTSQDAKSLGQAANLPAVKSDAPPTKNNTFLLLKLVPTQDKQQKVLYACLQVNTGYIEELRLVQRNGNRTRLLFEKGVHDSQPSNFFHFTPPPGTVVDLSK